MSSTSIRKAVSACLECEYTDFRDEELPIKFIIPMSSPFEITRQWLTVFSSCQKGELPARLLLSLLSGQRILKMRVWQLRFSPDLKCQQSSNSFD